ncbi:TPA: hypothetical protein EYO63_25530 [Candidatus Poribacteria bacterium]|nr:hypothetical protein [Candidatus Poribacteria bacterium]
MPEPDLVPIDPQELTTDPAGSTRLPGGHVPDQRVASCCPRPRRQPQRLRWSVPGPARRPADSRRVALDGESVRGLVSG